MKKQIAWLTALLLAPLVAAPALAQSEPAVLAPASDPYAELIRVIVGGVDEEVLLQSSLLQMRAAFLRDGEFAEIEAEKPGTIDAMFAAMMPVLRKHGARVSADYHHQLAAAMAQNMSAAEARQAAAFYGSPLGRRVMGRVQENYTVTASAREVVAEDGETNLSKSAIQQDNATTTRKAIAALGPDDRAAVEAQLKGKSWVIKLNALRPRMLELRTAMENAPMLPADEAAMEAAITAVVEERFGPVK